MMKQWNFRVVKAQRQTPQVDVLVAALLALADQLEAERQQARPSQP